MSRFGGEVPESQAEEPHAPRTPSGEDEAKGATASGTQPAADSKPRRATKRKAVDRVAGRPKYEKRPVRGGDACVACWAAARNKSASVGHLYRPPCLCAAALRGKWAKPGHVKEPQDGVRSETQGHDNNSDEVDGRTETVEAGE